MPFEMTVQQPVIKMSTLAAFLVITLLQADFTFGMDCSFGTSDNILDKIITSCPQFYQSAELSYCCYNFTTEKQYCCDAQTFMVKTGLGIIVPVVITAAIVISLIVCCISCLCCSCCPWYRRRHQGTVYGKVQTPSVIHVIQTPANAPPPTYSDQMAQHHSMPYPINPSAMPQPPPPQYTNEMYAKQAPYNPNYPQ